MLRLFAALPVPDDVAACLMPLQSGLPGARWVPRENFHITLKFLGKVDEATADEIDEALRALKGRPVPVALDSLGSFGDKTEVRSVFARVVLHERLKALAAKVDNITHDLGLERDKRRFTPHITLGRLRGTTNREVAKWMEECGQLIAPPFEATHFTLYSSLTRQDGAIYTPERHYIL